MLNIHLFTEYPIDQNFNMIFICGNFGISHFTSNLFYTKVIFHLNFKENAMIRIVDDLHGYAPGNRCTHHPDDCVIHSAGQRSIVSQICSSKSRCRDLIITRQHCNDRVTSYQQITYECVPSKLLKPVKILSL